MPEPTLPNPNVGIKTGKPPAPARRSDPEMRHLIYGDVGDVDDQPPPPWFYAAILVALLVLAPIAAWAYVLATPFLSWLFGSLGAAYGQLFPPSFR